MSFEPILYLGILIITAKLLGELMHRIGQPTIIGNVLAGIIVGPALLALVDPIDAIDLFISIGVFFLFFLIGLEEIDLPGLFRVLRGRLFVGSAIGFLIPFFAAGLFALSFSDMNLIKSFAIASVVGASSLGVTAKVLTDLGKLRSTIGLEIFTVTAIVEFIAIIFVSVVIQIGNNANQSLEIIDIGWLFVKMIAFFVIAGLVSVFVLPRFFRLIKSHLRVQQVYFGIVIGVILLVAYFAELSGIHGAIGALMLGIAVSRMNKEEYLEISKNVHAVGYGIFIPIFFAGIGLHFTFSFVELPIWIIVGMLAIIIGVKFVGSYIAVIIAKMRPATTVAFGVMSKGAVDLALMLSLLGVGIIDKPMFSLLVFGTLITMVVSSVELQRKLRKIVQVKVGTLELGLLPGFFRRVVSDYTAEQVMDKEFLKISADTTLNDFLNSNDVNSKSVFIVCDDEDNLVGLISQKEIKKIQKKNHNLFKINDIMYRKYHTVASSEQIFTVIQKMNSHPFDIIPVIDDTTSKQILGVVTGKNIMQLLIKKEEKDTT
jgi:Kef-type K+ transport system membrane component KefB/predicted transcriptional regulator